MTQFGKLPRPRAGAPRNDFAGPLSGFKRPQSPMAKIAELDAAFADVGRRLTHLEKSAGIVEAVTPSPDDAFNALVAQNDQTLAKIGQALTRIEEKQSHEWEDMLAAVAAWIEASPGLKYAIAMLLD